MQIWYNDKKQKVGRDYQVANNEFKASLLNDFNCFSMAQGYFKAGLKDKIGCFDLFFRHVPDNGGFAVCCGLQTALD